MPYKKNPKMTERNKKALKKGNKKGCGCIPKKKKRGGKKRK